MQGIPLYICHAPSSCYNNLLYLRLILLENGWNQVARDEFRKANKAGLAEIWEECRETGKKVAKVQTVKIKVPETEVVTAQITGIEVMDLDDAVSALRQSGIYTESGMGCTGSIIRVSGQNRF